MMEHAMEHTVKWPGTETRLANAPRFIGMHKGLGVFRATINRPSPGRAGGSTRT